MQTYFPPKRKSYMKAFTQWLLVRETLADVIHWNLVRSWLCYIVTVKNHRLRHPLCKWYSYSLSRVFVFVFLLLLFFSNICKYILPYPISDLRTGNYKVFFTLQHLPGPMMTQPPISSSWLQHSSCDTHLWTDQLKASSYFQCTTLLDSPQFSNYMLCTHVRCTALNMSISCCNHREIWSPPLPFQPAFFQHLLVVMGTETVCEQLWD